MRHIKRYNENTQVVKTDFKNSDEDIIQSFIDYHDDGRLTIKNHFLFNNQVVDETVYMKDTSKYKKCKVITLQLEKTNGIKVGMDSCITDIDTLEKAIDDIKRFYILMEEEVNYIIKHDFMGLSIKFITTGGSINSSESLSDQIDLWNERLKAAYIKKGFKTFKINGNWFEIKSSKDKVLNMYIALIKINDGETTLDNNTNDQNTDIINIRNEAFEKGLKFYISGGDNQIIIKFVKI